MKRRLKRQLSAFTRTAGCKAKRTADRHLRYESLEQRQLMTSVVDGTLVIDAGTPQADQVTVEMDYGSPRTKLDDKVVVTQSHVGSVDTRVFDVFRNVRGTWRRDITNILCRLGGGDDTLENSTPIPATVYGEAGNDSLRGGPGPDLMFGGPGADNIWGNGGPDKLYGDGGMKGTRGGDDVIRGGPGSDYIVGGPGADCLFGGVESDELFFGGWDGNDRIVGCAGRDYIFGQGGDDRIWGGFMSDRMNVALDEQGVGDDDHLFGGSGNDRLKGGPGKDNVHGGRGNDLLDGGQAGDRLFGDEGRDLVLGGNGKDFLQGGKGRDRLFGQKHNDILATDREDLRTLGGAGKDLVTLKKYGPYDGPSITPPGIYYNDVTKTLSIYGSVFADKAEVFRHEMPTPDENTPPLSSWTYVSLGHYANFGTKLIFVETDNWMSSQSELDLVEFYGRKGYDVFDNRTHIQAFASGGPGNDVLSGAAGGWLFGGADNDKLFTGDSGAGATLNGGAGDDELTGGLGPDLMYGEAGDDKLHGGGGYDTLHGGPDDDTLHADFGVLHGDGGNDVIYGDNATLNGGTGKDKLYSDGGVLDGGPDDDILVSIGYDSATLLGGGGSNSFWLDPNDAVADASDWELANRHVHEVDQFMSYINEQNTFPVNKELNGPDLIDPLPIIAEGVQLVLQNQAEKPLFASNGPNKDDVFQGGVGDCFFMAPLSGIADANPDFIRQMVVDLGDGTYAVRFYEGTTDVYIRIDADLWWSVGADEPRYAKLGQEESLWVPIVEKAYAFFREQPNLGERTGSYWAINGGGSPHGTFGAAGTEWTMDDVATSQEVADWYNNGQHEGQISDGINTYAHGLLNWIKGQHASGKAVVVSSATHVADDWQTVDDSSYRQANHVYMVDSVLTDSSGAPTGIRLRDPYGYHSSYEENGMVSSDGYFEISDFTHLYFWFTQWIASDVAPKST